MDLDLTLREFFTAAAPPRHALAACFGDSGVARHGSNRSPIDFRIEASDTA